MITERLGRIGHAMGGWRVLLTCYLQQRSPSLTTTQLYRVLDRKQGHFFNHSLIAYTNTHICNRHYTLISLTSIFFKLAKNHIVQLHTLTIQTTNIRQKVTKTVLFLGQ